MRQRWLLRPHLSSSLLLPTILKPTPVDDDISSSNEIPPLPNELMVKILEEVPMPQLLHLRSASDKILCSKCLGLTPSNNQGQSTVSMAGVQCVRVQNKYDSDCYAET